MYKDYELCELGKFIRGVMRDNDETLSEMADKLGVARSYLNCMLTGKDKMPVSWVNLFIDKYGIQGDELDKLLHIMVYDVNISKLDFKNFNLEQREMILKYAFGLLEK